MSELEFIKIIRQIMKSGSYESQNAELQKVYMSVHIDPSKAEMLEALKEIRSCCIDEDTLMWLNDIIARNGG